MRLTTLPFDQVFQHPGQVLRIDRNMVEHMQTIGDMNCTVVALVGQRIVQPVDQIQFGADQPAGCRVRSIGYGFDNEFGRADVIRLLANLETGFGVRDDRCRRETRGENSRSARA